MKKVLWIMLATVLNVAVFAQSEKFVKAMEQKMPMIDTVRSTDGLIELSNAFERIADAEKNQWLPYYYAALTMTSAGYNHTQGAAGSDAAKIDPIADKAEQLLNKAIALTSGNSEILCVQKMIATLRMMADPMNRWMQFGPIADEALAKAKAMNPDNPRVYLLEGQDKYFTPEQFGGSKEEAKLLFEEALKKYETFKPESSIHPNWGMGEVKYFLSLMK